MEKFEELKDIINNIEPDVHKFFEKSNAAAGTRVRKAMQEVKMLAQQLRVTIQETKNNKE